MIRVTNGEQFAVDLDRYSKILGITRVRMYRKLTVDLWNNIVMRTPVDTGRARASWNVAVGSPDPSVPPELEEGETYADPTLPGLANSLDADQMIYITSNLDYIQALEDGHSKQSPPNNMVKMAVVEEVARLQLNIEAASKQ